MTEQQQIEKMAQDICRLGKPCEKCSAYPDACKAVKYAEKFYNAGYRKQRENTVEVVGCKDCTYRDGEEDLCGNIYCGLHDGRFDKDGYCSYGKMKGGE